MDIKQEFREETDMDVYASYGNNGSFNNVYVKWLEAKLTLTDVVKPSLCELYDFGRQNKACEKKCNSCKWMEEQ